MLRLQDALLLDLLLGQTGAQGQRRAVFRQNRREQAVDIAQGLGRADALPAPFIRVRFGLLIHGLLHHGLGDPVQSEGHEAFQVVAPDVLITPDSGRGENAVLAGDVFLHGLIQRHAGGVPVDLFVVQLVLQGLILRLLFRVGGEGQVTALAVRRLAGVELDAPAPGGQFFCGRHVVFLP